MRGQQRRHLALDRADVAGAVRRRQHPEQPPGPPQSFARTLQRSFERRGYTVWVAHNPDEMEAALAAGASVPDAAKAASDAAAAGRDATLPLVARKGRASYLGERSAGHLDPGAASTAILFETLADALSDR